MTRSLSRAAAVAAALLVTGTATAADQWVYLGTYTGGKDGSKGIYKARLDARTGKLSAPELAAEVNSPSFLAVHPTGKFLYAVGETGGKDGGGVYAFAIDAKTGNLTKLNASTSGGSGPCHISVQPQGAAVTIANYGGGSTCVIALEPDGKLGKRVGFSQHKGSSVDPGRQKEPHAHCSFFTPDGKGVLTVDLGVDRVFHYLVDFQDGLGRAVDGKADVVTPPGSGPRHLAIAPDAKFAYVCGELDSTVNVIDLPARKVVQSLSTLPAPVKGNSTAECILHPSGKFVYVSNRGHNSVAVFKVGEDRKLTAVGHVTGDIKIPRNFNVDPSGKWMLIASQDGGKVGVFEVDAATGLAKETGNTVAVSKCVCVKFVPVEN